MVSETTDGIQVAVETAYLEQRSDPIRDRYAFAYRITIRNGSTRTVQLLNRHWVITEANGSIRMVDGPGVVGEQPVLEPGDEHEYTSGAVLSGPNGTMHGSYELIDDDGKLFSVTIPLFELEMPRTLH